MSAIYFNFSKSSLHWLSVTSLSEYLRRHVTRCTTGGGEDMELLFIHDSRQSKVGNEEVRIVLRRSEQQVLRLQVSVDNAVVVKVCDCRQRGSDQIASVGLIVVSFSTDAIEKLASKREVSNEVNCVGVSWAQFGVS